MEDTQRFHEGFSYKTKSGAFAKVLWTDEFFSIGFYYVEDSNGNMIPMPCRWDVNNGYFREQDDGNNLNLVRIDNE